MRQKTTIPTRLSLLLLPLLAAASAGRSQQTPPPLPPPPPAITAPIAVWKSAEPAGTSTGSSGTFTNPIVRNGADPWIVGRDGWYYMTHTKGWGVAVRRSATLAGLTGAREIPIWRGGGPGFETFSHDVWAPELHYLRGHWYVYYCATDGPDNDRRVFCLESKTDDPLGAYDFKGKVAVTGDDDYAIDPTIYERDSDKRLFLLWSGREKSTGHAQGIYIAPLSDPWTISGPRVRLSTPQYPWEKHGWQVNEGPEVIARGGKTFVTFSASGGTTPYYCLGLLTNTDGNLLSASSWTKSDHPVLGSFDSPAGPLYTVGHNGFFTSPDGKEDWIVFHAKKNQDHTWGGRDAYAAPISSLPQLDRELK